VFVVVGWLYSRYDFDIDTITRAKTTT